ncbi:MAG TPA: cysteine desulfurase [Chthoniobacteraceae bacterium]|nr:cysteine desulfurase [Chthoniobacteraceae bacterium]
MRSIRALGAGIRSDFPILDQEVRGKALVYLDNAATTQKPRRVIDALSRYYERDNSNVHRGLHELSNRATAQYEAARETMARYIGAASGETIIFTRGTTEGINLVANTWGARNIGPGDVILLTEMEHHSNIVPWQLLAERTGARIEWVPVPGDEGLLDMEAARRKLAQKPKIFSLVHVSNSLGTVNPAAELCALARSHGVITLLDGAQSAGHMPVNVQELGCDFYAFSGHKMCGPTGIGVLYGRADLLEKMPPWQGGGEMISRVDFDHTTYKAAPHRFEAGTPDIAGAIGLGVAAEYLEELDRAKIEDHSAALAQEAAGRLAAVPGMRLLGPRDGRAGLVSFALDDVHAHDVVSLADEEGVALRGGHHCTQPLMRKLGLVGSARASFYFYNTPQEVERLVDTVAQIERFFRR